MTLEILSVILENVVPLAAASITAAVAYGVALLRRLVKRTETKIDDEAFEAFLDGVSEGAKRGEKAVADARRTEGRKGEV